MSNLPENHNDISDSMRASPGDDNIHPVNRGVHPGTANRSDFDPDGVEVPARPTRALVDPTTANDARRTPSLGEVTVIEGKTNPVNDVPKAL